MIKRFLFAAFICAASTSGLFAQTSKGNLFVGSNLGVATYSSITNDYNYVDSGFKKTTNHNFGVNLNPQLGVFVTNHLIVGGSLGFNLNSNKADVSTTEGKLNSNSTKNNNFTVNAGPFIRYYFFTNPLSRNMVFAQVDTRVGTGSGTNSGSGENSLNSYTITGKNTKVFNWNSGASIGFTHFIGKNVGMDVYAGYNYDVNKNHNINTTNYTALNGGGNSYSTTEYDLTTHSNSFTFGLGFHWFIGGKKAS